MKRIIASSAAAFTALLIGQQAGAIGVTFSFKVNSSGPNIYPCNAGLLTPSENPQVCYKAGTTEKCKPTCLTADCMPAPQPNLASKSALLTKSDHDDSDDESDHGGSSGQTGSSETAPPTENTCVCNTIEGDRNANFMTATYSEWNTKSNTALQTVSGLDTYGKLFTESNAYGKTLQSLSFNLSSELYNAKYFVDMCYRAPQIDFRDVQTTWDLYGKVSLTDFGYQTGNLGYNGMAALQAQAIVICDLQKDECTDCTDANPVTDTRAAIFSEGTNFLSTSGKDAGRFDFSYAGSARTSFTSSLAEMFSIQNAFKNLGSVAPRFCKIRYVFSETNGSNSSLAIFRQWQKHGAQVCTYSQVESSKVAPRASLK